MSPESKKFLSELFSQPPFPPGATLEQSRDAFEHWMAQFPPPSDVRFEPFSMGPLSACWAFARGVTRQSILLFFHGGGFTQGSVRSHWGLMGRLSQASQCAVLGVNYRLAPENPYPAALEDALTAYKWLLRHPYPARRIALAGSSSGGGLALALLLRLKLEKLPLPKGCVCICPWLDLAKTDYAKVSDILRPERLIEASKSYCGKHDPKEPLISPTYGNLEEFPPLFIQTGTEEILHEEALQFAEKARASGVTVTLKTWPGMFHTWQIFASRVPEGQKAIDEIGLFLKNLF